MNLITISNKKWKYQVINPENKTGRFDLSRAQKEELKRLIIMEVEDMKSYQILKNYEDKYSDGTFLKINDASRDFEKTDIFNKLDMDALDALLHVETSEFVKVDIERGSLTKEDIYNIYYDGKQPHETAKLVYIFKCHYYDCENDKDVPVYLKFNFDYRKHQQTKQIYECLEIQSFHLDDSKFFDKINYNKNFADKAVEPDERSYDYINEDDYKMKNKAQNYFFQDRSK